MSKSQGYLILSILWLIDGNISKEKLMSIIADVFAIYLAWLAIREAQA